MATPNAQQNNPFDNLAHLFDGGILDQITQAKEQFMSAGATPLQNQCASTTGLLGLVSIGDMFRGGQEQQNCL